MARIRRINLILGLVAVFAVVIAVMDWWQPGDAQHLRQSEDHHLPMPVMMIANLAMAREAVADKPREVILQMAEHLGKQELDKADTLANQLIKKRPHLDEVMELFKLRTKGGLGIGSEAGVFKPDGIESMVTSFGAKGPAANNLVKPHSDALIRAAYVMAAVAEVIRDERVAKPIARRKLRVWMKTSGAMLDGAIEFAEAVNSQQPLAVKKAASKISNSCLGCHELFRGDGELAWFIDDLRDKKSPAATRIEAIKGIGRLVPSVAWPAIPTLLTILKDEDDAVSRESAKALDKIGLKFESDLQVLNDALKDATPFIRYWFAYNLRQRDLDETTAVRIMTTWLKNPENEVRAKSAEILGRIGPTAKEAIPALKDAAGDEDAAVRRWATSALKQIDVADITPILIQKMRKGDPVERGKAAIALGKEGKKVVPGLIAVLKETDRDVRVSALFALGRIGPDAKECVPVLLDLLKTDDEYLRKMVGDALKKIDQEAAAKAGLK